MEGAGEIKNFIMVWQAVFVSLCYCYTISKNVPKGITRLLTILPIVCLFFLLPLRLTSVHLGGNSGFFIAWLANFKLLLFAFNKGPLSSDPSISLPRFVAVACLPIKIQQQQQQNDHPSQQTDPKPQINTDPSQDLDPKVPQISGIDPKVPQNSGVDPKVPKTLPKGLNSPLNYAIKFLFFVMLVRVYDYSEHIHPTVILFLYCLHMYFLLEIILAMVAAMAQGILGLELEPQFNDPYLSTSLQDFWGRRWNLMVTGILRPTVYEPVVQFCTRPMGRKWAGLLGVLLTFLMSGIMHELMFYYLGRMRPTGELTLFFLLHGVCLMVEIAVKKELKGRYRLPRLVSGLLTVGFVMFTGFWLFFPQFIRCKADQRAIGEYAAIVAYLKDVGRTLTH